MTNDVAIIGVGLHPFGRFDKTAMEMGAEAIQLALADAGVDWKDIQFGFGGSYEVSNPDAVTRLVGLTGITFTNVFNACATAASAHSADRRHHPAGQVRHRHRHRAGQASARRVHRRPGQAGAAPVVRRERAVRHHEVLRHEGQPLPPQARHLAGDAGQGGRQELPQRRAEPECVPAQADFRGGDPQLGGAELPADAVHVLRARRGCGGGDHVPRRYRASLHQEAGVREGHRDPHPPFGAYEVHATSAPLDEDSSPTVYAARAAYEEAGIGPEDIDVAQLQDTDAGAEVIHMAETGSVRRR